jgi:tetratricopeptide (TPR) repeat protein
MNYCQGELAKLSGTKQSPPSLVNVQSPALKPAVSGGAVQEERGSEPEAVRELKERNKKTAEAGKTADNQKAPAIEKNERYANLMLALTYCRDKQYKKAVKLAESVLKEDSSNAWAHVVMGVACAGRGEIDEAIAEMQKALALNPKLGEAHYNLAGLTLKKDPRNKSPAAEHYQNALQFGAAPDPELEKRLQK